MSRMEYQHCIAVDPTTYDTFGLCGDFALQLSKYDNLAGKGCRRAQEDWRKFVGEIGNFNGCISPRANGISVFYPDCCPERIETVAYTNELGFMHDDDVDTATKEQCHAARIDFIAGFQISTEADLKVSTSGQRQLQAKMFLELLSIDREVTMMMMESWEEMLATPRRDRFSNLEDYLPYRLLEGGGHLMLDMQIFGMALRLTKEEREDCRKVSRPAWDHVMLSNDYFSWQREYDVLLQDESSHFMVNAVWIIMQEQSTTVEIAKELCLNRIRSTSEEYRRMKREYETTRQPSLDVRRLLAVLEATIAGNFVWSIDCPRYNFSGTISRREQSQDDDLKLRSVFKNGKGLTNGNSINRFSESTSTYSGHNCKDYSVSRQNQSLDDPDVFSSDPPSPARFKELPKILPNVMATNGHLEENLNEKEKDILLAGNLPRLGDEIVLAPFEYLNSLPSKGIRNVAIDAINVWFRNTEESLTLIKSVVNLLHNSSLMLDDIEDASPLRRGRPAAHAVFGSAQTINSADYLFVEALDAIQKLNSKPCLNIFIEELRNLHIGQSFDLYWTHSVICPSVEDYLKMVDNKTGGLFRLLTKLMEAKCTIDCNLGLDQLMTLVGRYFQIRDDYQNLVSADYTNQKGFCEDLDEGKFSFPLIHALETPSQKLQLRSILQERRVAGKLSFELKQMVLECLHRSKSLEHTKRALHALQSAIDNEIKRVETLSGVENFIMKLMMDRMQV